MSSLGQTLRSRNGLFLMFVLAGVEAYALYRLYVEYSLGGNSWKQGDWLINDLAGPIRRGLFGTALIRASDVLGTNPLLLVILFQALIATLIIVVVGMAALDLKVPDKLILILVSPGFLFFFWTSDPQGAMRKEILAYLAFLPLVVAALRGRGGYLAYSLSVIAYAMAVAAHEANLFSLPFLCVAIWLILPSGARVGARLALLAVPSLLALAAGLYASTHRYVCDKTPMCQQVIDRGLSASICDGAIAYVGVQHADLRMDPTGLLSTHFRNFLLIYAACLIGFRVLVQGSPRVELWSVAVLASGLIFSPLYILATDYGRWLSYHVSALVFLALICLLKWRPGWLYEPPLRMDFAVILAMSLVLGIQHVSGEMIDGPLVKLAVAIHDAIM